MKLPSHIGTASSSRATSGLVPALPTQAEERAAGPEERALSGPLAGLSSSGAARRCAVAGLPHVRRPPMQTKRRTHSVGRIGPSRRSLRIQRSTARRPQPRTRSWNPSMGRSLRPPMRRAALPPSPRRKPSYAPRWKICHLLRPRRSNVHCRQVTWNGRTHACRSASRPSGRMPGIRSLAI